MDVSYYNNDSRGSRERWGSKAQFVLVCIGSTISLVDIWGFPSMVYRNGGGAFFIAYFIMMVFMGIPFLLMALAVGQYTRNGPVKAVKMMMLGQPEYYGTGFAILVQNFFLSTYIIMLVARMMLYFVASFNLEQLFNTCDNAWNTQRCYTLASYNVTRSFLSVLSTDEYGSNEVYAGTQEDLGSIQWELFRFFAIAWFLVYICLHKGITSYGKVAYVTSTVPYLVLIILAVFGSTLEGSKEGIYYFFKPNWEKLFEIKTWLNAAYRTLHPFVTTAGSIITFSSYNDFHSRTLVRDTLIISFMNVFSELIGLCVVSLFLGHFAYLIKDEYFFSKYYEGAYYGSLVYGIFPAVLSTMSVPLLWCILFFTMAICFMINLQFSVVQVVITTLLDGFPKLKPFYCNRKEILVLYICLFTFACGIPCTFQGGHLYVSMIDFFIIVADSIIAFAVVATISFLYGTSRLLKNFEEMTSSSPNIYFVACWYIITPIFVLFGCVAGTLNFIQFHKYYDEFPYVGWSIVILTVIWIPVGFLYGVSKRLNMLITIRHQSQDHSTPLHRVLESDRDTCEAELTDTNETTI